MSHFNSFREALLNAIAHKDYSGGVPIQISVYSDKIIIWNEGHLSENWTVKNLLEKHASRPYNPDIANTLFRSGYIESWGRGTVKMIRECKQAGIPEPIFKYDSSDISIEFRKDIYNEKYLKTLNLNDRQVKAICFVKDKGKITNREYQTLNDVSKATATRDLTELTETHKILKRTGDIGVGTNYILIGSNDKNELHILYNNSRQQAHLVTHLHFLTTRKSNKKMQKKYQATATR